MKLTKNVCSAFSRLGLLIMVSLVFSFEVVAQSIELNLRNVTVQTAVMELQKKYGYSVAVKSNELDMSRIVNVDVSGKTVQEVVSVIFEGQDIDVVVNGKNITVAKSKDENPVMITVKGVVTDETGQPAIGAAVFEKGNGSNGVVTGLDGDYVITVPSDAFLRVSYIGYKDSEVAVAGKATVNVNLAVDSELLEDAIVVGYGVASKKLVSSSIASVKMETVDRGAELDPMKALQGRVTGVSITSSSGIPGSTPMVVVRGVSSISGNSSPLYVVDGIPAESYPNINAADIESMEVLKDASATAIYGSRANSGVIIITTKSGKSGKTKVNVSGQYGFAQIAKDIPMANTDQWIDV